MSVRPPGSRRPYQATEPSVTGLGQALPAAGPPAMARAIQSGRAVEIPILKERRERAEAAGPPGPDMLEVVLACREVHRAEDALRERARRGAPGEASSKPSDAPKGGEGQPPAASAEAMGRRQIEDLRRAQERLRAALRRAGAAESEPPGGR